MKTNWPALRTGFLILASLAVGTTAWPAQTQELAGATTTPAVISSVAILQSAMQRASVRVEGEGKLEARAARMQNPERLVLDFNGARLGVQKTAIPGVQAPVLGVRLGQFRANVVRVVIDLTEATRFQLSHDGTAVVVMFSEEPAAPSQGGNDYFAAREHSGAQPFRAEFRETSDYSPRFALPGELTQPSFTTGIVWREERAGASDGKFGPGSAASHPAGQHRCRNGSAEFTSLSCSSASGQIYG